MKDLTKKILKIISKPHINLKENYKIYRKIINFFSPHTEPIYSMLDFKIYSENREIPVRLFVPEKSKSQNIIIFLPFLFVNCIVNIWKNAILFFNIF